LYDERNGGENQDENESPEVSKEVSNTMPPGKILYFLGGFLMNLWVLGRFSKTLIHTFWKISRRSCQEQRAENSILNEHKLTLQVQIKEGR